MTLARPKYQSHESLAEAAFYSERSLPKMGATTVHVAPLLLEVPLFSVARNKAGVNVDATWTKPGRGSIRYRGPALSQSHQTLFLTLVHVRAGQPVGNAIDFNPSELLTLMGWSDNGRNIERLRSMLEDLFEARLDVWGPDETERHALSVRFFADKHVPDERAKLWSVSLSEKVLHLFKGHLSYLNVRKRANLREGLATFLYGYVSASNGAVPFDVEGIRQASGAETRAGAFGGKLREALDTLVENGCIADYKATGGKVRVYH
jgi:TrfA protein